MRNRILYCLVIVVLCLGCELNKQPSDKKIFRYNESAGITSLDPAFAKDQANIWACNQLFNGLVQFDEALNVVPCIAKRWVVSEDGRQYTFYLRDDVYFHDDDCFKGGKGRRVVAADFVYSFKRLLDEDIASPGMWVLNNLTNNPFVVMNDTVLELHLAKSFPPFLGLLCMKYCSVVPFEAVNYYKDDFGRRPIGTGPFHFAYWKEGNKLIMLKNKRYFEFDKGKRLPYLDAVSVSFIIDKQTAFLEFIKGNIDFISGIDAGYKDELLTPRGALNDKYKDRLYLIKQPYLNTEYLGFLMDTLDGDDADNPLKDVRVRKAINYGFDRIKMMAYLRNNIGRPALNGMVPQGIPGFNGKMGYGYDYRPDLAARLLAEAGYPNGKGLPKIKLSTTASYLDICNYLQHELGQIGIQLEIDVMPPASLREMIALSKLKFFRGSWIADYADAENYLSLFYSNNLCPKGPNYTHFSNHDFDKLYRLSMGVSDDNTRIKYYRQMDSLVMTNAVIIPLYYDEVLRFVRNNVVGLGSNPLNLLDLRYVDKLKP